MRKIILYFKSDVNQTFSLGSKRVDSSFLGPFCEHDDNTWPMIKDLAIN
jgi:hypothetical protein